jgi:hypothetical protein
MVPHMKQRIFVVKPNVRSRFVQDPLHTKQHNVYEAVSLDSQNKRLDAIGKCQ